MHAICITGIVFGAVILALVIFCGTILMAIRMRHGGVSPKDRKYQTDEAKMIQEIYHGLSGMEKRVEALETILMDRQGKDKQ